MEKPEDADVKAIMRRVYGNKPDLTPSGDLLLGEVDIEPLQFHYTSDVVVV